MWILRTRKKLRFRIITKEVSTSNNSRSNFEDHLELALCGKEYFKKKERMD